MTNDEIARIIEDYKEKTMDAGRRMDIAVAKIHEWQDRFEAGEVSEPDCRDRQRPWAEKYKAARSDLDRLKQIGANLREMAEQLDAMKEKGFRLEGVVA